MNDQKRMYWETGILNGQVYILVKDNELQKQYMFTFADPDNALYIADGMIKSAWTLKTHEARN